MADYKFGVGEELRLHSVASDLSHTWDFGDGTPTSSEASPVHIYTNQGIYTVTHTARDFCSACAIAGSHTVEISQASITVRSILLDKYTANIGDIVKITTVAQNLSPVYGTGSIIIKYDNNTISTYDVTLDVGQEVTFDIEHQITSGGTINICADNVCTMLSVESMISVQSVTVDNSISTGQLITTTITVKNDGTFTEDKTVDTKMADQDGTTVVIDSRTLSMSPGEIRPYDVLIDVTSIPNGPYTICAENICKAVSIAKPSEMIGNLSISSSPSGAEIFVDGEPKGQFTPSTITNIPIGYHSFRLKLSGYSDTFSSPLDPILITAGNTTYIHTILSPLAPTIGSINISSTPTGAQIYVDNNQQFDINNQPLTTPATIGNLSPTSHVITLKLSGYDDYNKTIDIIAGQTIYLVASFVQTPIPIGNINFVTTPVGAEIFIDDISTGQFTPITITDIPTGPHTFILKYSGRNDATGSIDVIGGATSYVYSALSLLEGTTGSMNIVSSPTNAEIIIDGVVQRDQNDQLILTPTTISGISPGNHDIIVRKTGYVDYSEQINVVSDQTTYVGILLRMIPTNVGSVNFTSVPEGAQIFLDDESTGKFTNNTLVNVEIGSHTFRLELAGRNPTIGVITVVGNATTYVNADMSLISPTIGGLNIVSYPPNADILIDNTLILEKTPVLIENLPTGINYNITLKKVGYDDFRTTVDIVAGQTWYIGATLTRTVSITQAQQAGIPWWILGGLAIGIFYAAKKSRETYKEVQKLSLIEKQKTSQLKELSSGKKDKTVTLTKKDYRIKSTTRPAISLNTAPS